MKSLLAEFDILLNVGGYTSVNEIDRKAIGMYNGLDTAEPGLTIVETHERAYPLIAEKSKL